MNALWTLAELADRVADALTGTTAEPASARVRGVPDARTIRWYQTTGLVDRPSTLRGRTALYGRRHLLQLVAIKRLQAEGRSLAEIQGELAGIGTAALERLAALAPGLTSPSDPGRPAADEPVRQRFWAEAHLTDADLSAYAHGATTSASAVPAPAGAGAAGLPAGARPDVPIQGVRLDSGVLLILDHPARALEPADVASIQTAAAPLLAALRRIGLRTNLSARTAADGHHAPAPTAPSEVEQAAGSDHTSDSDRRTTKEPA